MAKEASFGHLATVDLKSASDRLSCRLVERLFRRRPEILEAMMACRTSLLRQDIDKSCPTWLTLNKFATQGSALTFPVQSFVFYCISVAACLFQKGLDVTLENVETVKPEIVVYGDDIIVPTAVYRELIDALHQLGLKVNETKSFGSGYFRESCGSDWYKGVNVTPSYIRSDFDPLTPTSIASLLEVSNNFHRNGCWSLAEFVAKRIPRGYLDKIAIEDGKLAIKGLFSFCGSDLSHLRMRYNESLMRREYLVLQVRSKRKGTRPDGVLRLRQYFTERPAPNVSWDPVAFSRSVPVITRKWSSLY
jgi:hypothetical protein